MKLKQKELEIVYEGIIMFTSDNTRGWHDRLPKDQFDIAMDFARVSQKTAERSILQKKKNYSCYKGRKTWKKYGGQEKEGDKFSGGEREAGQRNWEGGLVTVQQRGCWKIYFLPLKTEKRKKSALKIELGFRQKVLGVDCDKSIFLSSKCVVKMLDELLCNLL